MARRSHLDMQEALDFLATGLDLDIMDQSILGIVNDESVYEMQLGVKAYSKQRLKEIVKKYASDCETA